MEFPTIVLGAVGIIPMVLGIVEAAKKLGIEGKGSFGLAIGLGGAFAALGESMAQGLIPAVALPWIAVGVAGIGGGLAATGLYDFATRKDA